MYRVRLLVGIMLPMLLPMALAGVHGMFIPSAQAALACDTDGIGGPPVASYLSMLKSGLLSYSIDPAGSAVFTNQSECEIKMRFFSTEFFDAYDDIPFDTSVLQTIRPHSTMTLHVRVPSCAFRLTLQPYYRVQRDSQGKSVLHSIANFALPYCSVTGFESAYAGLQEPSLQAQLNMSIQPPKNAPSKNCVLVRVQSFDQAGAPIATDLPTTTIRLDAKKKASTDAFGYAWFTSVSEGSHVVTEDVPDGWAQLSIHPFKGIATVFKDARCSVVLIRNELLQSTPTGPLFQLTSDKQFIRPGEQLQFTLQLRNDQRRDALLPLSVRIPEELTILGVSGRGSVYAENTVDWGLTSVPAHSTKTLSIQALLPASSNYANYLVAEATVADSYVSAGVSIVAWEQQVQHSSMNASVSSSRSISSTRSSSSRVSSVSVALSSSSVSSNAAPQGASEQEGTADYIGEVFSSSPFLHPFVSSQVAQEPVASPSGGSAFETISMVFLGIIAVILILVAVFYLAIKD